jgi:EmrB/QacA subfamily drug resistance transporter
VGHDPCRNRDGKVVEKLSYVNGKGSGPNALRLYGPAWYKKHSGAPRSGQMAKPVTGREAFDAAVPVAAQPEASSDVDPEWAVLTAVALATMLAPINSTMIVVALPDIVRDFGATVSAGGLLVTLYLIVMASCQPVAGKLGDRWGRRPSILVSLLAFAAVSVGAALAPSLAVLVTFRVLQALCAGIALPNGVALLREIIPAHRRASRFGLVGSAAGVAAACGPPLGGLLTQFGGWRSMFLVNLLLVVPALVIGWQTFPRTPRMRGRSPFDVVGAALLTCVLVGLAALLIRAPDQPAALSGAWAVLVLLVMAVFFVRELKIADPVLQIRLFRIPAFAAGNTAIALSNLAMYTTLLAVPLLEGERSHLAPAQIGVLLAAMSAANLVAAPLGGRLSDQFGRRWPTVGGLSLSVPPLLVLVIAGDAIPLGLLAASLGVAGFGFGMGWAGLQTAVIESVSVRAAGMAAGMFSTSRYLGSIVGTSVLAGVAGTGHGQHNFVPVFAMCLAAAIISALVCVKLHDRVREHA